MKNIKGFTLLPGEYIVTDFPSVTSLNEVRKNFYGDNNDEINSKWKFFICSKWSTASDGFGDEHSINDYIYKEVSHLPVFTYREWLQLKMQTENCSENNVDKMIVGYVLKPDCDKYILAIENIIKPNLFTVRLYMSDQSDSIELLREFNVLNLWFDPVYGDKETVVYFGDVKFRFTKGKKFAYTDKGIIYKKNIRIILDHKLKCRGALEDVSELRAILKEFYNQSC